MEAYVKDNMINDIAGNLIPDDIRVDAGMFRTRTVLALANLADKHIEFLHEAITNRCAELSK